MSSDMDKYYLRYTHTHSLSPGVELPCVSFVDEQCQKGEDEGISPERVYLPRGKAMPA